MYLFCAMAARSQTATGTIVGTVTDSSGAAVASAKVTVTNASTNAKIEVITNAEGDFTAPLLPPGSYSVAVSAAGFKAFEQTGIRLQVQQQARVDVVLQVGALSESVQVTADAAVVEATTSSVGKVVDNKRIAELPLNTRNVYSLVNLTPGLAGSIGNAHNAVSFSVNGSRGGTFDVLVDGSSGAFPTVNGFAGRFGISLGGRGGRVQAAGAELSGRVRAQHDGGAEPGLQVGRQRVPRQRVRVSAQLRAGRQQLLLQPARRRAAQLQAQPVRRQLQRTDPPQQAVLPVRV